MAKKVKQGAEAVVYEVTEGGMPSILKHRFKKSYRLPELDALLTQSRLKQEVRSCVLPATPRGARYRIAVVPHTVPLTSCTQRLQHPARASAWCPGTGHFPREYREVAAGHARNQR